MTQSAAPPEGHLHRYVSRLVTDWDDVSPDLPYRKVKGTLVFLDISGFTSLTERLAAKGRVGAEELTRVLDRVFGDMLVAAYARRGSLLKFGGDALLLHFDGENHCLQGISAAIEMRSALRRASEMKTSVGRISLKMTVGVCTGSFDAYLVGESHRDAMLAGASIDGVLTVEGSAEPGEIILSRSAAALVPDRMLGEWNGVGYRLRGRTTVAELPGPVIRDRVPDPDLAQFIPKALRRRLSSGFQDPEHKLATVGFIKFAGLAEMRAEQGPAAVHAAVNEIVVAVQEALDHEGVTFLNFDVDIGSGKITAIAGVPDTVVDDAGRVLRAFRRVLDREYRLPVRAGVNHGHLLVAEPGTPFRASFTVMGDVINSAARIMAVAKPGELLAHPSVLERSATLFDTGQAAAIVAKGKTIDLLAAPVNEEIGRREKSLDDALPFVGRAEELRAVTHAFREAGRLTVLGDTGIGKTRLVGEAVKELRVEPLLVRGEPAGQENPYWAFRDPLLALLEIDRGAPHVMARMLHERVAGRAPALLEQLPLIGDATQVPIPDNASTALIGERHRPAETARAIGDLLEAFLGVRPIVVDDLHWLDEASTVLVQTLVARRSLGAIVATARPVEGVQPIGTPLPLGPLADDDLRAAAREATAAFPPRPEVLDMVVERADGNPLFLNELLSVLSTLGSDGELPETLTGVAGVQIDALEPLSREILRIASVLGRSFRRAVLEGLLNEEGLALEESAVVALDDLLEMGGDRWRFRHPMIQEAAYEGLAYRKRQELHAIAGLGIERQVGEQTESMAEGLAYHWNAAGDHQRAWHYGLEAGRKARRAYANTAAERYLRLALAAGRKVAAPPKELVKAWSDLGDVLERQARFAEARRAYSEALQLSKGGRSDRRALIHVRRARTWMREGSIANARRLVTLGKRDVGSGDACLGILGSFEAAIAMTAEQPARAASLAESVIPRAERAGDRKALARAYSVLDWANAMLGVESEIDYGLKALELLEAQGELERASDVLNNKGGFAYFAGDWEAAVAWYEQASDHARKAGNHMDAAIISANVLELLVGQRRFEEAAELLPEVRRTLVALGVDMYLPFVDLQHGRLLLGRGELEAAATLLQEQVDTTIEGDPFTALQAAIPLSEALARLGRAADALALLEQAGVAAGEYASYVAPGLARARVILGAVGLEVGLEQVSGSGSVLDELELLEWMHECEPGAMTPAREDRRHQLTEQLGVVSRS